MVRGHEAGLSGRAGCLCLFGCRAGGWEQRGELGVGRWGSRSDALPLGAGYMNLSVLWRVRRSTGPATDGRGASEVGSCFSLERLEPRPWDDLGGR